MADKKTFYLGTLLIVASIFSIYVSMSDDVRMRVDNDKNVFYVNKSNRWLISGIEEFKMVNRTKTVPRIRSGIKRTDDFNYETNVTTINRITPYKGGCMVNTTWTFDGKNTELKNFPISHTIERINCTGLRLEVDWKRLVYTGETIKDVTSPQSFGRNMKVEWDGDYYYSRIWKYKWKDEGKLTVKWRTPTDYEIINVRLFDPPTDISACTVLNSAGTTYHLTADITNSGSSTCMDITANNITLDCQGHTIDGIDGLVTTGIKINRGTDTTTNITLNNCSISDWEYGISIYKSNYNIVSNFFSTSNIYYGIILSQSNYNNFTNVTSNDNGYHGISLDSSSNYNILDNLTLKNNNDKGIVISYSDNNILKSSIIQDNVNYGILLYNADTNIIYNNLFNNTNNFDVDVHSNNINTTKQTGERICSFGTEIGGNYWTNSTGNEYSDTCNDANEDGFCDSSYNLNFANIDYLPLSDEFSYIDFSSPTIDNYHAQITNSFTVNISLKESNPTNFTYRLYNSTSLINETTYTSYPASIIWTVTDNNTFYYNVTAYDSSSNYWFTETRLIRINTDIIILSPENRTYDIIDIDLNWSAKFTPNWSAYSLNSGSNVTLNQDTLQETQNTPDANSCDAQIYHCSYASDGNINSCAEIISGTGGYWIYQNFTGIEYWVEEIKISTLGSCQRCPTFPHYPDVDVYYWNYGSSSWSLLYSLSYDDNCSGGGTYDYCKYWKDLTIQNNSNTVSGGILQIKTQIMRMWCAQVGSNIKTILYETKIEKYNETWDKNTTIHATAGINDIIIYGNDSSGNLYSDQVYFFVNDTLDLYLNGQNNSRIYELGSIAELSINTSLSNESTTIYVEDKLITTVNTNATYNWTTETFNYTEPSFIVDTNISYSYNTYDDKQYGLFEISTNGSVTDIKVNKFTLYGNISGSTGTIDKTYIDDTVINFVTPGIETTYMNVTEDSTSCDINMTINGTTAESTQTYFGNGLTTQNISFNVDGGNETMDIYIPRYATMVSANVTITGTNSSYYETVSLTDNAWVEYNYYRTGGGDQYDYSLRGIGASVRDAWIETSTNYFTHYHRKTYLQYSHADYASIVELTLYLYVYSYGQGCNSPPCGTFYVKEVADDSWDENSILWTGSPTFGNTLYTLSMGNMFTGYHTIDITAYGKSSMIQSLGLPEEMTDNSGYYTTTTYIYPRLDDNNPAYIRAYHYPTTFKIDTGNDGIYDYEVPILNVTDEEIELNYTAMQDYIDNQCTTDMCSVPLLLLSSTDGQVPFKNLKVVYTMAPYNVRMDIGGETVFTSSGTLNYTSFMIYDIDTSDSRVAIEIHNDRTGNVTIESMNQTYTVGEMNTSNIDWFNISAKNWNGNQATAKITQYYDGSANMTIKVNNSYYSAEHEAEIYYSNFSLVYPPNFIDYVLFIPQTNESNYETPYGQTSSISIMNITSFANHSMNISLYLENTLDCANVTYSLTSDFASESIINETELTIISLLTAFSYQEIWMRANFSCNTTIGYYDLYDVQNSCCYNCIDCW